VDEDPDGDGKKVIMNLRFPGQYFDEETGLHYNYFRDYYAGIGRYIEPDPIGLEGGVNLYSYVLNNPVNHIDPDGKLLFIVVAPGAYTLVMALADLAIIGGSWWLIHTALQSGIESECDNPCEVFAARPRGRDPEVKPAPPWDLGPLREAPGMPGWKYPPSDPNDPDFIKEPHDFDKWSKWRRFWWRARKYAAKILAAFHNPC
jgi:RHS repeat-associated protein